MSNLAQLTPPLLPQFLNTNGLPLAGGFIYSYVAGTTTPQSTYTDATGATPNANPVVLDANGCGQIWLLNSLSYKFVVQDSLGNTIYTRDNVQNINDGSITAAKIAGGAIGATEIAAGSIGSTQIAAGGVASSNIANGAVGATQIAVGAIGATQLVSNIFNVINSPLNLATGGVEIVFRNPGDFDLGNQIIGVPQYSWSGFTNQLGNPGTLPAAGATAAAFSPNGEFLAVANNSTPNLTIYQRQAKNIFTALASPGTLPAGTATGVAWSPNGRLLAVTSGGSPYLQVYMKAGTTFVKLLTQATMPSGVCNGCAWSPNGEFLSVASSSSPYILNYQFSGGMLYSAIGSAPTGQVGTISSVAMPATYAATTANSAINPSFSQVSQDFSEVVNVIDNMGVGLFSKLSDPANLPAGAANGCAWSSSGSYLAVAHATTPFVTVYSLSGTTFTKLANPGTLPPAAGNCVAWSPSENVLVHGCSTTPYATVFRQSAGAISYNAGDQPAWLPAGPIFSLAFSPNGLSVAVGMNVTPYLYQYGFTVPGGTAMGIAGIPSALAGAAMGVSWAPNSQFLACALSAAPYLAIFETTNTLNSNGVLWTRQVNNV